MKKGQANTCPFFVFVPKKSVPFSLFDSMGESPYEQSRAGSIDGIINSQNGDDGSLAARPFAEFFEPGAEQRNPRELVSRCKSAPLQSKSLRPKGRRSDLVARRRRRAFPAGVDEPSGMKPISRAACTPPVAQIFMKPAKPSDLIRYTSPASRMTNEQLVNQSSGDVEKYTPSYIINAARVVMPIIHLDPASCQNANEIVGALRYFTKKDDGLSKPWLAQNVWLNHPYGKPEKTCKATCTKKKCRIRGFCISEDIAGNEDWINKFINEYKLKHFEQGCCLTFASTSEGWHQPLLNFPQCFIRGRVSHILASGEAQDGTPKGSCVTYLGPNVKEFAAAFGHLGRVKVPFANT